MPRIDLTIDVRDDKIWVSHPEKGTLLDLQNTVLFEKNSGKLVGVGITKDQYFSEVPNHINEEDLSIEKVICEPGITSRRTYAALDYLILRGISIVRPDLYKLPFPVFGKMNLNLFIRDYSTLPDETQEKFEFELISNTQANSYSINGKDSSHVARNMLASVGLRMILYFLLIPILMLFYTTETLFGNWLEQYISPPVSLNIFVIVLIISASIFVTVFIFVCDWIWLRLVKNLIPRSAIIAEINRRKDYPRWAKEMLIRSI